MKSMTVNSMKYFTHKRCPCSPNQPHLFKVVHMVLGKMEYNFVTLILYKNKIMTDCLTLLVMESLKAKFYNIWMVWRFVALCLCITVSLLINCVVLWIWVSGTKSLWDVNTQGKHLILSISVALWEKWVLHFPPIFISNRHKRLHWNSVPDSAHIVTKAETCVLSVCWNRNKHGVGEICNRLFELFTSVKARLGGVWINFLCWPSGSYKVLESPLTSLWDLQEHRMVT